MPALYPSMVAIALNSSRKAKLKATTEVQIIGEVHHSVGLCNGSVPGFGFGNDGYKIHIYFPRASQSSAF